MSITGKEIFLAAGFSTSDYNAVKRYEEGDRDDFVIMCMIEYRAVIIRYFFHGN